MKKIYMILVALMCTATVVAQQTVQGIVRNDVPAEAPVVKATPTNASTFTFDSIQNWTGTGSNRAALVIQWTGSTDALVFGYKFSGDATGSDMIFDIVKNNPRFFCLTESTSYGTTVGGFGWDADNDGFTLTKNGTTVTPDEYGCYAASDYDYDDYSAGDSDDLWNSGWMSNGYWSYNISTDPATSISWASTGCSGRTLTDGCWDMWLFSPFSGSSNTWGTLVSAPNNTPVPTSVKDVNSNKAVASVKYVNLAGQQNVQPFSGVNIVVTTYTDGTTATSKVIK